MYLETTIPSYLAAWPSRDLVRAAHQQITAEWWDQRRSKYELFISQVVIRECSAGDPAAAAERMDLIRDLLLLEETDEAVALAQTLMDRVPLPERAADWGMNHGNRQRAPGGPRDPRGIREAI